MNKENNRSAAGLRRSAIAERLRLREEWSELKGISNEPDLRRNILGKKRQNIVDDKGLTNAATYTNCNTDKSKEISEVLSGLVILVDVGSETRSLALRAALAALGAKVVPSWNRFVTHLVWSQGGCRSTRAKARTLACRLVSPLWVEACASAGRRLPEKVFPAPSRPSDLPSPATLRKLLKKAEQENIPLEKYLSDSENTENAKQPRLRISSDTSHTTTTSHDTSRDKSTDKSRRRIEDTSQDSPDTETRVNTAPRRPLSTVKKSQKPAKSKRKLFTQKEAEINTSDEESDTGQRPAGPKTMLPSKLTQRGRRELAKAERMARRLVGGSKGTQTDRPAVKNSQNNPRIILTGLSPTERREAFLAIRQLEGRVQKRVDRKTTHIILGSCSRTSDPQTADPKSPPNNTKQNSNPLRANRKSPKNNPLVMCNQCNSPGKILNQMFQTNVVVTQSQGTAAKNVVCTCHNISGVASLNASSEENDNLNVSAVDNGHLNVSTVDAGHLNVSGVDDGHLNLSQEENGQRIVSPVDNGRLNVSPADNERLNVFNVDNERLNVVNAKPRTINALLGAARGCRVLNLQWVRDSLRAKRWLNHIGYEVPHLKKMSQKARVERSALQKLGSEYAYDVFNGMRVSVSPYAEQRDAVIQLLTLCGAIVQDGRQKNSENTPKQRTNRGLVLKFGPQHSIRVQNKTKHGGKTDKRTQNGRRVDNRSKHGGFTQNGEQTQDGGRIQDGGHETADVDLTVGRGNGEVCSKWVFDSVAASRMRTTRRYINIS